VKHVKQFWWIALTVVVAVVPSTLFSWGFFAHKWIHREAIKLLPVPLRSFYESVADSVVEKSVEPDKRRRRVQNEEFHHYIDIDHYGRYPFLEVPRDYQAAVQKYSADTLLSYGDSPWNVARVMDSLTVAMRQGRTKEVVQFSADLGHYVADLHMPLHSSENYDGQRSGNNGIHGRFEWQMIERRIHTLAIRNAFISGARILMTLITKNFLLPPAQLPISKSAPPQKPWRAIGIRRGCAPAARN
jgi:hypothetical protein